MSGIPNTVESLLAAVLIGKGLLTKRTSRVDEALTVLAILLCASGVILSILGLERLLETHYSPDVAAFLAAAAAFTVALLAALAQRLKNSFRRHAIRNTGNEIEKNLRGIFETLEEGIHEPIRDNPKMAVLIAALAGFAATQRRN